MGQVKHRGSGGPKLPKQELMSIIVLGKNKSHLKSSRIPKQPVTPVIYDGGMREGILR